MGRVAFSVTPLYLQALPLDRTPSLLVNKLLGGVPGTCAGLTSGSIGPSSVLDARADPLDRFPAETVGRLANLCLGRCPVPVMPLKNLPQSNRRMDGGDPVVSVEHALTGHSRDRRRHRKRPEDRRAEVGMAD